jgi:hypothetical protein
MTDSCEISFSKEPREARKEGTISKTGDVTSKESLPKVVYKPGKSKSLSTSLHLEHTSTCTCTQPGRLGSRVKSLTPTEILHTIMHEGTSRKLSAPEMGMAEKYKEHQRHMYANNFRILHTQQGTKHLIGLHLYCGERSYCQYRLVGKELPPELDEFWLLRRDSHEEVRSANSAIFILEQSKLQSERRRNVTYFAVDETVCGKRNANSKTKRRCSTSGTRSTSKMHGHQRRRQSLRRNSQQLGSRKTDVPIYSEMSASDRSDDNNTVTISSNMRVIDDPESNGAYEDTAYNVVSASDKRRRLLGSLFTAFVIMLVAVAIIMLSATLSIGAGGTGST